MVCHPPRVQSPVITAMWTTGVGTELELTQSSHLSTVHIASQADITQHQLLPTRTVKNHRSQETSVTLVYCIFWGIFRPPNLANLRISCYLSFCSLSLTEPSVWLTIFWCLVLCWSLISDSDSERSRVVCNYPRRIPSSGSDQMVTRTNEVVTTDGIKGFLDNLHSNYSSTNIYHLLIRSSNHHQSSVRSEVRGQNM